MENLPFIKLYTNNILVVTLTTNEDTKIEKVTHT